MNVIMTTQYMHDSASFIGHKTFALNTLQNISWLMCLSVYVLLTYMTVQILTL